MSRFTLPHAKAVSWRHIGLFIAVEIALSVFINQAIFAGTAFDPLLSGLWRLSGGLVNATLAANMLNLLVIVVLLFLVLFRLRPVDIGLVARHLPGAALVTLATWALAQGIILLYQIAAMGSAAWHPQWEAKGILPVLGVLAGQMFGNALVEEIEFRGFLMTQLYQKFARHRVALAVLGSLVVFTLMHIANRLILGTATGSLAGDLLIIAWWGLFLSLVYLFTGNLFMAVGIHAVINAPTLLFETELMPQIPTALAAVVVLAVWRQTRASRA